MQFLHLAAGPDGISRFADGEIPLAMHDFAPPAPAMWASEPQEAARVLFLTLPAGWGGAQHPSPRRQYAFCLAGRLRVEAGDGEVREIGPGGIWLMADTAGPGHRTEVIGEAPVQLAIVQLD